MIVLKAIADPRGRLREKPSWEWRTSAWDVHRFRFDQVRRMRGQAQPPGKSGRGPLALSIGVKGRQTTSSPLGSGITIGSKAGSARTRSLASELRVKLDPAGRSWQSPGSQSELPAFAATESGCPCASVSASQQPCSRASREMLKSDSTHITKPPLLTRLVKSCRTRRRWAMRGDADEYIGRARPKYIGRVRPKVNPTHEVHAAIPTRPGERGVAVESAPHDPWRTRAIAGAGRQSAR